MNTTITEKRASGIIAVYEIKNGKKILIGASWTTHGLRTDC